MSLLTHAQKGKSRRWGLSFLFLLSLSVFPSCKTGFSDLHNSSLYRMYQENDPKGLTNAAAIVNEKTLSKAGAKTLVFSIGLPRFDLNATQAPSMPKVLTLMRDLRGQMAKTQLQKLSWTFAMEGSWLMDGEIRWLDSLYAAGLRIFQPGHRFVNAFFTQANESEKGPIFMNSETKFSAKGLDLLEHSRALGIVLDVAHLGDSAFWEVIEWNNNRRPIIASHANAYALCAVDRNLKDEQIKAIAATGGLVGVCFHGPMLSSDPNLADIEAVVDHLAYMIALVGWEHVCIGTDWEGLIQPAKGLESPKGIAQLGIALRKRGYSKQVVDAVLWKNVEVFVEKEKLGQLLF